jgi:hypothetical protein
VLSIQDTIRESGIPSGLEIRGGVITFFTPYMIDESDDMKNAADSIRVKCEFGSNVIDESDVQSLKHFEPRVSTLLGISISEDFEKCRINL